MIKEIRQDEITIQQVKIDIYCLFYEEATRYIKAKDEWIKEKRGKPELVDSLKPVIKEKDYYGIKVTIRVANFELIDKALESMSSLCKFKVERGKVIEVKSFPEFKHELGLTE